MNMDTEQHFAACVTCSGAGGAAGGMEWAECPECNGHGRTQPTLPPDAGLEHRYNVVRRSTGETVTDCFVLRPDRDPHALAALEVYADACRVEHPLLAANLDSWIVAIQEGGELVPHGTSVIRSPYCATAETGGLHYMGRDGFEVIEDALKERWAAHRVPFWKAFLFLIGGRHRG